MPNDEERHRIKLRLQVFRALISLVVGACIVVGYFLSWDMGLLAVSSGIALVAGLGVSYLHEAVLFGQLSEWRARLIKWIGLLVLLGIALIFGLVRNR